VWHWSRVHRTVKSEIVGLQSVAIIGYDDDNDCWIVKNSWRAAWARVVWRTLAIRILGMPFMEQDDTLLKDLAYRPETPEEVSRLEMTRAWSRALVVPESYHVVGTAVVAALNNMDLIITIDPANNVGGGLAVRELIEMVGKDGIPRPDKDRFAIIRGRRPKLTWCKDGKHDTTEDPCSQHPAK
jgi:hypothetical protein